MPDLLGLLRDLWRGRLVIGGVTGLAFLAAFAASKLQTPEYQGVAVIQLLPRAGQEVEGGQVVALDAGGYLEARERARTQIQIIQSRGVRVAVAERYAALELPGEDPIQPTEAGLEKLERSLSTGPREDTQLVEIRVTHTDPERAAVLANLFATVYQDVNLDSRRSLARGTSDWLAKQQAVAEGDLQAATGAVLAFKAEHDVADIEDEVDDIAARLGALQTARGVATTDRVLAEGRLREEQRLLSGAQYDVLAGMFDDQSLATAARELARVRAEAAQVRSRYGEKHPEYQRAMAHLEQADALVAEEVGRLVKAEAALVDTLRRQERNLDEELATVKQELLAKQRLKQDYDRLKFAEDRARGLYASLDQRGTTVDLAADTRLNDVVVVDEAVPPSRQSKPNLVLNLAVSLVLGFGAGVALVLARRQLDGTLRTPGQIEALLDVAVVGVIPELDGKLTDRQRAMYGWTRPRSLYAESVRAVRASLGEPPKNGPCRQLLVTSTVDGEGKSDLALGLAVAFAKTGVDVLLVDADLRRPRQHVLLDLQRKPGIAECLTKNVDPRKAVQATEVPNLSLLSAGEEVVHPDEVMSGRALKAVCDRVSSGFQVIVIDSAPVGLVADGIDLARSADDVLMVVRHGRTEASLAARTVQRLEQVGVTFAGAVLNAVPRGEHPARGSRAYYDDRPRDEALAS